MLPMTRALIGLGSNVGDRLQSLRHAVRQLSQTRDIHVRAASSVYETAPVGPAAQDWFLNAVLEVDTSADPVRLLRETQAIERLLGREPTYHWGPRTIDLDILLYGHIRTATASLTIPHPEICRRAFVMVPLLELDPTLVLPDGTEVSACLRELSPPQQVRLFAPAAALAP